MDVVQNEPKRKNRVATINDSSKLPPNVKVKKVKRKNEYLKIDNSSSKISSQKYLKIIRNKN